MPCKSSKHEAGSASTDGSQQCVRANAVQQCSDQSAPDAVLPFLQKNAVQPPSVGCSCCPMAACWGEAPAPVHCAPGHADHASAHVCVAVLTMLVHICVTRWCAQVRSFLVQTCASGHASGSVTGDGATCAVSCPRTMQRASGGRPRGGIGAAHVPPVPPAPVHATLQCMTCARTAPAATRSPPPGRRDRVPALCALCQNPRASPR